MSKAYVDHNFLSEEEYNYQKTVKDYNLWLQNLENINIKNLYY